MEELKLSEVKEIQLSILDHFDKYCKANSINYSLVGGSLIGAIRHSGFIPWDDDIDVMMTRDNYQKLLSTYQHEKYKLLTPYTDSSYPYPFAKMIDTETLMIEEMEEAYPSMGVYIDIFPFDERPPKANFLNIILLKKIQTIKTLANSKDRKLSRQLLLKLLRIMLRPISINTVSRIIDRKSQKWNNLNLDYSILVWANDLNVIFTKKEMEETKDCSFESLHCLITKHYDSVLTKRFGDYMKLPPESERIEKHAFKAYRK